MHAGLWAAVGLAAAPRLVMFARRIFIDIWITAFMSLTLMFFALSERYPRAATPVPGPDVRLDRPRRADEGAGRDRAARPRVRALPAHAEGAAADPRDDDSARHADRRRDRRAVVRRALSRARMDLHHVVLHRREHRAVHVGTRRASAAGPGSTCRSSSATRFRSRRSCLPRPRCGGASARGFRRSCGAGSWRSCCSSRFRRESRTCTSFPSSPPWPALAAPRSNDR